MEEVAKLMSSLATEISQDLEDLKEIFQTTGVELWNCLKTYAVARRLQQIVGGHGAK